MSSICRICLRSDLLLQTPNDDLKQFYDELCEYDCDMTIKFCEECLYSLKKCYRFKQRCKLAVQTLKEWQKKKHCAKKSIKFLYTEMPKSQLSLCNKNNFKVYFYQAADVNTAAPIQISNCRHPHVVTVNIPPSEYTEDLQIEPPIKPEESEMSEDEIYIIKVDPNFDQNDNMDYKMEFTELDSTELNSFNISEYDTNSDSKMEQDSDASLDELLSDIQTKSLLDDKKVQKPKEDDNVEREKWRKLLQSKFESSGVVKDDKGNVIDMDLVLSCLDKSCEKTVRTIINMCSGPGPLKPLAIRKLSELQNRFTKYESIFTITYLKDESQIREEFEKRREHIKYTSSQHRCEKCIRGFRTNTALESHMKIYHDKSLVFVCKYCQTRCRNKKALTGHMSTHSIMFKCKLCHFVTGRGNVRRHYNTHKGVTYQCKYCEACFVCESLLYFHINKVHASRQIICEFCAQTFNNTRGLTGHKALKHRGEEFVQSELNKKCDECDVTFINEDAYNTHLVKTHGIMIERTNRNVENVKYNVERKKRKLNLKRICRVCNREGYSPGWLVGHFLREHPNEDMEEIYGATRKYLCQECGKRFRNITILNSHKNDHIGAKPFPCDKCPAKFNSQRNLNNHLERHFPPSRECQHCGKKFVSVSNLNNHMRTHIGDRRYKCEICAKGFLHRSSLNEHVRGVHYHIRRVKKKPVKTDVE